MSDVSKTTVPDSYEAAFYDICALLNVPAMPVSPKQAYRDAVRPRLVRLLELAGANPGIAL